MKIEIKGDQVIEAVDVILHDVFSGVGIQTDDGLFGVAQRDGGIEVMLDGEIIFSSAKIHGQGEEDWDMRIAVAMMATVLEQRHAPEFSEVLERPAVAASIVNARRYLSDILGAKIARSVATTPDGGEGT